MADSQQATPFPTPPPFYKHFTAANLRRLREQQKARKEHEDGAPEGEDDTSQLAIELQYLVPPRPPVDGKWRAFGFNHDLNAADPTLEQAGIPRLYPAHPAVKLAPQTYLIALARSILATFLSTCGILAQNPGLYEERTKHLKDMVMNMHDLINQYRPHQARESLILMMEEHIEQLRQEIQGIDEMKDKVGKTIEDGPQQDNLEVRDTETSEHTTTPDVSSVSNRAQYQRAAWHSLQGLVNVDSRDSLANGGIERGEDAGMAHEGG